MLSLESPQTTLVSARSAHLISSRRTPRPNHCSHRLIPTLAASSHTRPLPTDCLADCLAIESILVVAALALMCSRTCGSNADQVELLSELNGANKTLFSGPDEFARDEPIAETPAPSSSSASASLEVSTYDPGTISPGSHDDENEAQSTSEPTSEGSNAPFVLKTARSSTTAGQSTSETTKET